MKRNYTTRLRPSTIAWLRRQERPASAIVEAAIREEMQKKPKSKKREKKKPCGFWLSQEVIFWLRRQENAARVIEKILQRKKEATTTLQE